MNRQNDGSAGTSLWDLIPFELRQSVHKSLEGIFTLFHPRKYINNLRFEIWPVILIRLLILELCFSMLQTTVFLAGSDRSFWLQTSFQVAIYDIIFSLTIFPSVWISLKILRHPYPTKIALGFVLPIRYFALMPSIIFYGLFVTLENYLFTYPRAICFYLAIIGIVFSASIWAFNEKRKIIAGCLLTSSLFVIQTYFISKPIDSKQFETGIREMLFTYDPIGDEINQKVNTTIDYLDIEHRMSIYKSASTTADSIILAHSQQNDIAMTSALLKLQENWLAARSKYFEQCIIFKTIIQSNLSSSKYITTKNLLNQELDLANQIEYIGKLFDIYSRNPSLKNLLDILDADGKLMRSSTLFFQDHTNLIKLQTKLINQRIITI